MNGVELHTSVDVALVLDSRHFPVLIATWFGTPNREIGEASLAWLRRSIARAAEEDTQVVVACNTRSLTTKPSRELRDFFTERIDEIAASAPGRLLGMHVNVHNPLVRGVIAMMLWLLRGNVRIDTVSTMTVALTRAKLALESAGLTPPASLDPQTYECPIDPHRRLDEVSNA